MAIGGVGLVGAPDIVTRVGELLAIVSSLMWGTADFIGGNASKRLPSFAVYGWSMLIGALVLVVAVTVTESWSTPLGYLPWSLLAAAAGLIGMNAFYRALALGPMGIISPLVSLAVIVPLAASLLRGETPSSLQVLGIVAAIVGVLLASGPELGGAESARPLVYAGVALVSFGVIFIAFAEGSKVSALMTMTGMRIATVVVCGVVLLFVRTTGGVRMADVPMLATIAVFDAGANVIFGVATTLGLLSVTAVLGSLYPVVTAVLAAVVLRERLRVVQYVGVACAMLGVILLSASA